VGGRLDSLAILPSMNFSAALATFVGQNLGAGKPARVKKGLHATIRMSALFSLIITLIMQLFPEQLMSLFTHDPNVVAIGRQYLVIVSTFYIVFSAMFSLSGVLRGAGDTLVPMFITLFALWVVRIPSAWLLSRHFGVVGIWWAVPLGAFTGFTLTYLYYLTGRYQKKVIVRKVPPPPTETAP